MATDLYFAVLVAIISGRSGHWKYRCRISDHDISAEVVTKNVFASLVITSGRKS